MRFQSAPLSRAAQNRFRPPKKKPRTRTQKERTKTDKAERRIESAKRRAASLASASFFSRRRQQQPAHRQAFINPGSLNARPAGMEPGAGRFRQPAILGADPDFADRMRAAVRPKQPAGRSGAQRKHGSPNRAAPIVEKPHSRNATKCQVCAFARRARRGPKRSGM